jgi:hypothetical protein
LKTALFADRTAEIWFKPFLIDKDSISWQQSTTSQ